MARRQGRRMLGSGHRFATAVSGISQLVTRADSIAREARMLLERGLWIDPDPRDPSEAERIRLLMAELVVALRVAMEAAGEVIDHLDAASDKSVVR